MSTPTITTASELVRLRAADDGRGILFEGRRMDVGRGCPGGVRTRRRCFAGLREPGPFHVGVLLENTPEYLFLLVRRGARRRRRSSASTRPAGVTSSPATSTTPTASW